MPYAIGLAIGVLTCLLTHIARFDRDRALYPTILIVVACYYVLFAAMAGQALVAEITAALAFIAIAALGFARNLWWVAAALAGHSVFDIFHAGFIANPGVPTWWPAFCMAADVGLAAGMAYYLFQGQIRPTAN